MIRRVFAVAIAATFIIGIAHADLPLPMVAAGTSARNGLPVQGVTGGVPIKITCPDGTCSGTGGTASSVTVADGAIATQKLAVDAAGKIGINNFPATQPISAASLPLPSGAAQDRATAASPNSCRLSDGVAFYKPTTPSDTQPVSGTVTANAGSGTFSNQQSNVTSDYDTGAGAQSVTMFGVALPASGGAVPGGTASNPFRTDPTGTTSQPVIGTLTCNAGTGTFAVAGSVTANQGTAAALSSAWPGKLTDGTNAVAVKAASTAAAAADPAAVVALSPNSPLPTGSNTIGTVNAPAITKATQGSTGFSTQDLKDAGRVIKVLSAANFTAATTEAVITLTPVTDGTAGTTGTTFAVTSTKRWRLQSLTCDTKNAGAAVQGVVVKVRMTATGACTATSPVIGTCAAGTFTATANVVGSGSDSFPDGIELSGTMQVCISEVGTATAGNDVALIGFEY